MIPAIIPARGGSKGIRGKNIMPLCGRPLLAWTIEQALAARQVTEVIVSTDDESIASVATSRGARVFWRSHRTATDFATSESALCEVVENGFQEADAIVFLQATSPIRQPGEIDQAIEMVITGECDSVFSARRVEGYTWRWSAIDNVLSQQYVTRLPRQQQSTCTLEENGSIYVFRPSILLQGGSRVGGRIRPLLMHPLDSFQIDEPEDIDLMRQLMEVRLDCVRTAEGR